MKSIWLGVAAFTLAACSSGSSDPWVGFGPNPPLKGPQAGLIPTIGIPDVVGWPADAAPKAPAVAKPKPAAKAAAPKAAASPAAKASKPKAAAKPAAKAAKSKAAPKKS